MQDIYTYFIRFHIIFSVLFLAVIIAITAWFIYGYFSQRDFGNSEGRLKRLFLGLLYTDLLLGVILYFFLQKPGESMTTSEAMTYSSLRFWAIQHFSNIVFVVILCATGNMLINRTSSGHKKYKYSIFYFGISTVAIIISVALFALRK